MKKAMLSLLPVLLLLGACKKDSCKTDAASLAGAYKVSAVKYKINSSLPEADYTDEFFSEPCEKDDVLTLNANGTYTVTDAGVVCSPAGGDSGSWSVSGNTINVLDEDYNISSFNCNDLVLTYSNFFTEGDLITITLRQQ